MLYAKITNDIIEKTESRPNWINEDGTPVSDEVLAQHGWLPVVYNDPEYDPEIQRTEMLPQTEWAIESARVVVEYAVTPLPFSEMQAAALSRINAEYNARTSILAEGYPANEQQSWPVQIREADVILAGDTETPTPWIDNAAAGRRLSRAAMAQLIREQDTAYRTYHGALTGIRQGLRDQIMAIADDARAGTAFQAIQWPTQ